MFKVILKSMYQKKIAILFILIQLCVINYILIEILTTFNVFNNQQREIDETLGDLREDLIKVEFKDVYPSDAFTGNVSELQNYINSLNGVNFSGGFFTTTYCFDELRNNEEYNKLNENRQKISKNKISPEITECVLLDKGMDNLMKLNIEEGRGISDNDFYVGGSQVVPVIIGNKLKDIIKVGDELNTIDLISTEGETKFVVVGILEEGSISIGENNPIAFKQINLDNNIIIPFYDGIQKNALPVAAKSSSYYIGCKSNEFIEEIRFKVMNKAQQLGLNVSVYTIDEIVKEYKKENIEVYNIIIITMIFVFIFTVFSISSTILTSIKKRKYELGVRIITGASTSYIKGLFIYEILILTIASSIITLAYYIYNQYIFYTQFLEQQFIISQVISGKVILGVSIVIVVVVITSSYIPLRQLNKLQPKNLLGGNY